MISFTTCTQNRCCKKKSKLSIDHGKYLYSELRKYICNNNFNFINVVETGTARGFSAICMAKAMFDEKQNGQIFTFDIIPHDKKLYWNNIVDVTYGKSTRKELLQEWNYLTEQYVKFINNFAHIYLKSINFERCILLSLMDRITHTISNMNLKK